LRCGLAALGGGHVLLRLGLVRHWRSRRTHDANAEEISRGSAQSSSSAAGAARAHADAGCLTCGRRGCGGVSSGSLRQLIGNRFGFGGPGNFEVIATSTEVDYAVVVGVLEHADEHPIAETLAIATKELTRLRANRTGANGRVVGGHGADGATDEIERFLAGEALAAHTDPVFRCRGLVDRWLGSRVAWCSLRTYFARPAVLAATATAPTPATTARPPAFLFALARFRDGDGSWSGTGNRSGTTRGEVDLELPVFELVHREKTLVLRVLDEAGELGHAE